MSIAERASEITPPVRLYNSIDTLPANSEPSTVRTATTTSASIGPYNISAASENMLARPIFAPGTNSGGN